MTPALTCVNRRCIRQSRYRSDTHHALRKVVAQRSQLRLPLEQGRLGFLAVQHLPHRIHEQGELVNVRFGVIALLVGDAYNGKRSFLP
jgi:hypothetical protein